MRGTTSIGAVLCPSADCARAKGPIDDTEGIFLRPPARGAHWWLVGGGPHSVALHTGSVLYDGPEYVYYTTPGTWGHQFLGLPEAQAGTVPYRGGASDSTALHFGARLAQTSCRFFFNPIITDTVVRL